MIGAMKGGVICDELALMAAPDAVGPPARSIPSVFAEIVESAPPGHLAYVGADGSLTYAELDRQSNQLAHALSQVIGGVEGGKQKVVALLLPHTAASIVGILGVLKAGHLCAPLAPEHGSQHHLQVVEDCLPAAVVTIQPLAEQAQVLAVAGAPVLVLDSLSASVSSVPLHVEIAPTANALLLYTSGTTGRPRGVLRTHLQTTAYAYYQAQDMRLTGASRVAHFNSYAFAGSAMMLYGALLNGATLYAFPLQAATLASLYAFLLDAQITTMSPLVSTLRSLADLAGNYPPLASMSTVVTGGEPLHTQDVTSIMRILPPGCQLIYSLSSTETSTFSRFFIEAGAPWEMERVPVGHPPPYIELMIVDEERHPLPPGTEGEIAVRSRYITPGYWNQPDLNATKFLPDPEGGDRRILLTGDRGCINADGMLEHRGRKDFMVKVRGYRVEPEGIEARLMAHPSVSECVVVARSSRGGDAQLVAYLVAREQASIGVVTVRDWLAESLPGYMIPSRFVFLTRLPRNANSKVDRPALPPPGRLRPDLDTPFIAPRTELEQQIADIWAEVLGLDEVGVEDNFFELGGDSILAMRMAQVVEQATDIRISPEFFRTPTISALARIDTDAHPADGTSSPATSIAPLVDQTIPIVENQPTRGLPFFQRVGRALVSRGPTLNGWAIPYASGIKLQRLWLRTPGLQSLLMQRQLARLAVWRHSVATHAEWQDVVESSLAANTWIAWRTCALIKPTMQQRWSITRIAEETDRALRNAQPMILVDNHCAAHWARHGVYDLYGVKSVRVGYSGPKSSSDLHADYARKMIAARDALAQAQSVLIAGDGFGGWQGVDVPFFGYTRRFRAGAAELAVQSDAELIPVFTTLRADGVIVNEFLPPLTRENGTHATQVEGLTRQYAACYLARWPALLASLPWGQLETLNRELGLTPNPRRF